MVSFFTYLCYVLRIYIYRPSIKGHELTGGEKNHNIEAGGFLNKASSPTMLKRAIVKDRFFWIVISRAVLFEFDCVNLYIYVHIY